MRKPFAIAISLLLVLGNVLPTVQPTLTNAAPPPPVWPTPALRTEPTASLQAHTPPPPDKLPLQIEQARARQAMETALEKHLRYWGPRYQVAPVEVQVDGDWAHGVAKWKSQARTFKEPINVLAHRLPNDEWQALMPETDGLYSLWLDAVPERLVPASAKSQLRAQAAEANILKRPQVKPMVPPPVTIPEQEKPSGPVEEDSIPTQPTATRMAAPPVAVTPLREGWPSGPVGPLPTAIPLEGFQGPAILGSEQARRAAHFRMSVQTSQGYAPLWDKATLGDPISLYDLSGQVTAYLFPVSKERVPAGYLTVAALALPNPVIEFSSEGATPLVGARAMIEREGYYLPAATRPLYLGVLSYGYELVSTKSGQRLVFDLLERATFSVSEEEARIPLRQRVRSDTSPSEAQTLSPQSYKLIAGVPDWNQFNGSYGCASGCSPTAATNAMGYWDSNGYGSLINGSDWQSAVNEMRGFMGTFCDNGQGATYIDRISPGIVSYAQTKGYTFSSELWCSGCPTSSTYDHYRTETDGNRPMVVDVIGHSKYGDHSVTGVGYETNGSYMIIHDNWQSTGENVYIQYGSGYSSIYMHPIVPSGGTDTTPPDGDYTSPSNGATVGRTVHLAAWASDNSGGSGVKEVHFTAKWSGQWRLVYNDTSAPYEYDWDLCASGVPDGDIELGLDIYDNAGNVFHLHLKHANPHITKSYDCNPPPSCSPNANQIALYVDPNYGGQCVVKETGDYPNPSAIGLPNDSISSIRVGSSVKATLCKDDNYGGGCETFTGDDPDLGNNGIGNDQVSSVRVESRCSPNANQVALFVDPSYTGQCVVKDIGQYSNPNAIGLPNDSISSVKVGGSVQAVLCRDDGYGGGCETFTGDDPDLGGNSIGNDQVSSAKVEQRAQPPSPPNPVSPGNGSIFNEGQEITLCWSATGDEYSGEVWGGPVGTLPFDQTSGTCKNIGSPWAGYTYSWHVRARNSAGQSDWSSTWTFTVKPAAPSNLSAQTASCSQINLYWTDNSGKEEGYRIYRNGSPVGQVGMNSTNYQNTGLNENTNYSYYVRAYRGSIESDSSNPVSISTPVCPPPQPDLMPSQWGGWQYPVVPSSITGTVIVNMLYVGRPTYIDWGLTNSGSTNTGGNTYGDLYIDNTQLAHYDFGNVQAGQTWGFFDWGITVSTPGWHKLKSVSDPDNLIAESDETNNTFERWFYWMPTAPYSDNMEKGTNDWTATGLWHQVDSSSPYPASHSATHSWWYGQDSTGNYDTGSANSGDLTSPDVYIPSTGYYLRFWYLYETETQEPDWDQRWVQISVDGGPFSNILQLVDDPTNWWLQSQAIDLSGYAGHVIQVRFHFDTLDAEFNNYRGWYIDDLDISTAPPPSCADTHEPNNTISQATAIAYGQNLSAGICPGGDYDYYAFNGTAGDKVVVDIDAKVNGSQLDSYIFLLDSDGTSVLSASDDEILYEVQDSKLGYQLPHNGAYYIKVRAWNHPSVGGTGYSYNIRVYTDTIAPTAAITSPVSDSYINTNTRTIVVSASDSGSGVNRVEFLWHDGNWDNPDWVWLGADYDGRDGWSWNFDASSLLDQQDTVFYIWAFDWIGSWTGAGSWHVGLDRTPPTASAGIIPMYGDAPFRDFYIAWNGSDNLSGIANYDVQRKDGETGAWANLLAGTTSTYHRFTGQNGHTYYFRTRARDQAGNLGNYTDGATAYTVQICPISPDIYETDGAYSSAKWITTDGVSQIHTVHAEGDQDWARFFAVAGATYALTTQNIGGHADTVLHIYGPNGSTLIGSNDDYPGMGYASRIDWQPATSGVYYAMVKHWDEYAYGCTTSYSLSVESNAMVHRLYLPLILRDPTSSTPPAPAIRILYFRVNFQGRDNAAGKLQNVPFKVRIKNISHPAVLFESGWIPVIPAGGSSNWGTASVDVSSAGLMPGQSYRVFVQGAMHLVKRVTLPLMDGVTIDYNDPSLNSDGVLWSCDINEDNMVNMADLSTMLTYWGATPSGALNPSSALYRSDLNGDGTINESDQSICLVNWGKGGDSD